MKDVYTQFNEALAELDKAGKGKRSEFEERAKSLTSVEAKINCAKFVLGVKPVTESRRINKKNGSEVITESAVSQNLSEAKQFREKSDELMYDAMNLSEADRRKIKNLPPVGVNLTPTQLREFRLMRSYRINESDAVRLALKVA